MSNEGKAVNRSFICLGILKHAQKIFSGKKLYSFFEKDNKEILLMDGLLFVVLY